MNKRFDFDKKLNKNFDYLIGTDEAGRGPGAGPVFAAAVCFTNLDLKLKKQLENLNDSKQLTEKAREELYEIIINNSIYSVVQGSVEDIEKNNILRTSLMSMNTACLNVIKELNEGNIIVLVDGNKKIPQFQYTQQTIVKGDSKSASIAAASIVAKVSRDRFMKELDKEFPQYSWAENKGYMTQAHLDAVDKYGLTKWHRKKFFEKHFDKSKQLALFK
jgi:ribonuclease HII